MHVEQMMWIIKRMSSWGGKPRDRGNFWVEEVMRRARLLAFTLNCITGTFEYRLKEPGGQHLF